MFYHQNHQFIRISCEFWVRNPSLISGYSKWVILVKCQLSYFHLYHKMTMSTLY